MSKGLIMLAAGGTGGHLFPAEALAHALIDRGYEVHLVTDSRAERFVGKFPASEIHVVPSATIGSKNPLSILRSLYTLWKGTQVAKRLFKRLQPKVVVGFGGYPTLPPLMAASALGIATMIHEQNAVMGRANRMLASRVNAIAGGFLPENQGAYAAKTVTTGNPVRPGVIEAARQPYRPSGDADVFNLVVFGGSQGAQYFSTSVPTAISLLAESLKKRLRITQQARPEDVDRVTSCFTKLGIPADISPFFNDMAGRIADAQLVICRSGASTVSEISVIGRPSVLVPYPFALDHDQAANAAGLMAKGGAQVIAQADLDPERLSEILSEAMYDKDKLSSMAEAARQAGKPDAALLLADMVESIAGGHSIADFKGVHS